MPKRISKSQKLLNAMSHIGRSIVSGNKYNKTVPKEKRCTSFLLSLKHQPYHLVEIAYKEVDNYNKVINKHKRKQNA